MTLTPGQLTILKNDLAASEFAGVEHTPDKAYLIAEAYNAQASPTCTVWKTTVSISQIGDKINGTELAGLTSLNNTRLQTVVILSANGVNPSLVDRRQFFDDIFSGAGGATTRANLLVLWKRFATRAEKLFAVGTGSDASPATLTFEGSLTYINIVSAWNA